MRTDILFTAAIAALLTPSLAAYTCPEEMGPYNTPKCCPIDNFAQCTNPPTVPDVFGDFFRICTEEPGQKEPYCCVLKGDEAVDCRPPTLPLPF
ncbi:hypothetical protein V495_03041 [Pseudogymnoascus sp. VKM F-4514 (FW-929)]|nr:hypothetical protein V495_03041 [Pseudogymnoascus sp. VKM F-4514 (FW-929)]KFY51951.1 hypothetical protein V497_08734 [Pseudogymnoascus sp. VKM F-4516 (FW-969)]